LANTNRYAGLARGPIDHNASAVINSIASTPIDMGAVVLLASPSSSELLPRVAQGTTQGSSLVYGIVVGGDADGIYNDGSTVSSDDNRAATAAGEGVVVVTQGRCPARVGGSNAVLLGSKLTPSATTGILELAADDDYVIATALDSVLAADQDIIPVDVQREGLNNTT